MLLRKPTSPKLTLSSSPRLAIGFAARARRRGPGRCTAASRPWCPPPAPRAVRNASACGDLIRSADAVLAAAAPWVDGGHVQQLNGLAVFVKALFGVEDRQAGKTGFAAQRWLSGSRARTCCVVFAFFCALGNSVFRSRRIGQQLLQLLRLAQKHRRRAARALGEFQHQALLPVADLRRWQPTLAAPIGGGTDAHPWAAVDVFALVNIEHRKRRQRLRPPHPCVMGKLARPAC